MGCQGLGKPPVLKGYVFMAEHKTKRCRICGDYKPLDEMVKDNRNKSGYTNECKKCYNEKYSSRYYPEGMSRIGFKVPEGVHDFLMGLSVEADLPLREYLSGMAEKWDGGRGNGAYAPETVSAWAEKKITVNTFLSDEGHRNLAEHGGPFRKKSAEMAYAACLGAFSAGYVPGKLIGLPPYSGAEKRRVDIKVPMTLAGFLNRKSGRKKSAFYDKIVEEYEPGGVLPAGNALLAEAYRKGAAPVTPHIGRSNMIKLAEEGAKVFRHPTEELLFAVFDYAFKNGFVI